jgi:hypothetical protein
MNMFTAALLLGTVVTVPANAQNSVLFHSGVNLSVAAMQTAPKWRSHRNKLRTRSAWPKPPRSALISSASASHWRRGPTRARRADQQKALILANEIIHQVLSRGMQVDVVMMAGSLSTTTAARLVCTAEPSAVAAWTAGWQAVLTLLPDTSHVAFEPLNEPPGCSKGDKVWNTTQLSLYHQVRAHRRAVQFVVYGHHWGEV